MPTYRRSLVFAACLIGLLAPLAQAEQALSPSAVASLKRIDAHYNHLRSLRTDFTETYDGLGLHRAETGSLLLSKPGKMRWLYTSPKGKLFVLNGKFAWSYTPGDAQAQRVSAKQMEDQRSPLRFLLGHTQLQSELTGITVAQVPSGTLVTGIPRGQEQRLKLLTIATDPSGLIQHLRLEEIDGSVTDFRFSDTQENPPVSPGDFVFTPPPGVPVIDGLPPV